MYFVFLFWALCYVAHHTLDYVWGSVTRAQERFYQLELGNRYDKNGHLQLCEMRNRLRSALDDVLNLVLELQLGIRRASAAVVPALLLVYVVMAFCGAGELWDGFFPEWVVSRAAAAAGWFVDLLLDELLWEVKR